MVKLGIDARLISQTGVGVYIRNLLLFLPRFIPENWQVYVYLLKRDMQTLSLPQKQFFRRMADVQWHSVGEQFKLIDVLDEDGLDLVHFTYFSFPVLYPKRFVATLHDLTPILFKTGKASTQNQLIYHLKHAAFTYMLKEQVKKSSAVITPTETVKKQAISFFGEKYRDKFFPIYEGVNEEIKEVKVNEALHKQFKKPFFFYIGNFYPHKNIERLVKAFAYLRGDVDLILAGPDDFFSQGVQSQIRLLNLAGRVHFLKNPSLPDLVFLYKSGLALVHPALSEGFGLTTVEAAYFGTPILASHIEVMQEVLGGNYMSFGPYNVDDITAKMQSFLRKRPKFNYKKMLEKYSFEKMTKETVEIYKKALL